MYRKFITTIAAASIALTALGSQAVHAGERDNANAQAIAAILGIAALGAIIHNNKKDKKRDNQVHHRPAPIHSPDYNRYQNPKPTYSPPRYYQPKPRPLPQRANRKLLPKQCFRSFETHRGKVRIFGKRCLKKHFHHVNRLPRQCEYIFNTSRGDRRGYEARCLRDRGYRLARG